MKFKNAAGALKSRLWFNIFLRVAVIFILFVLVLTVCNATLLSHFFCYSQKNDLMAQLKRIEAIDISDSKAVSQTLTDIRDSYNFDAEIYDSRGNIKYTTHGSQMMDFFVNGHTNFMMQHEDLQVVKTEQLADGIVFCEAVRRFDGGEFLLCRKEIDSGIFAEVKIQKQLILSSAKTASEFVTVVAVVCLLLSLGWVVFFAKKFASPITEMNQITRDMAALKFDRKISLDRTDEIGQLAQSVNEMSHSLFTTLDDLRRTNLRLHDEIELERQLDAMRRGFVANVSHELKTPIAIISGYAEGLKLNVSPEKREQYCDTIIDESSHMNELVLSILELSKYESGQIPLNKTKFDISESVSVLGERIFGSGDICFENKILSGTLVFADKMQIEQVVKAYLENAKSHTAIGGSVTVSAAVLDCKLRVSVHNTGSHIEPLQMQLIWQSFYRGDSSHKRDEGRFGLGLSIVSAIMNMHGNACGVANTENGVEFWFDVDI